MSKIVVVTGSSAGVGRAVAREFARRRCDLALLARNAERLQAAAEELRAQGVRVLPISVDVADAAAVEAAAARIEQELGPIDIWVNNAMATVFAPVAETTAKEFRRGTEVTYLGQVHGTLSALSRMRERNKGVIVNVGSALAYRAIPLQAVYCAAKHAARAFTDSLRTELLHDGSRVKISMVHLPALNTPQFDWALNKTGRKAQPLPPIFQPEVAARAIVDAGFHPRRETWVGLPTLKLILASRIAPGLLDWVLARKGYTGQITSEPLSPDAPANLFNTVDGAYRAHGRFDAEAQEESRAVVTSRQASLLTAGALGLAGLLLYRRLTGRREEGEADEADPDEIE